MIEVTTINTLLPVIVLLLLGVITAVATRAIKVSPIVGYIALGLALNAGGVNLSVGLTTIQLLANLGVIFLLFDIGLHFEVRHVKAQASNIFGFGTAQVLFGAAGIGATALLFGIPVGPAFLIGAVLALSSTAVVERVIAERLQQTCPVGQTATSILVFQDVAAIFLLIIANAMEGGGQVGTAAALALLKAGAAVGVTVLVARVAIGPLLALVARTRNDEVFTATALLISLAAGWATGNLGLSLTLGAFLGGLALAETPYRPVIASEIKPFRGLLLGFFFISIGLSLDVSAIARYWPAILGVTLLFTVVKILTNVGASRVFKWSIPGSTQLGFLLGQGSEFAFVILILPPVRDAIGQVHEAVLVSVVALSMAMTPFVAQLGRVLAGHMRRTLDQRQSSELLKQTTGAEVIIIGMGVVGRTVADALRKFDFEYFSIERDEGRLRTAIADGYNAFFGDGFDMRMWESMALHERSISVLTRPEVSILTQTAALIRERYPRLRRFAIATSEEEADLLRSIGLSVIVDKGPTRGVDAAAGILAQLNVPPEQIEAWAGDQLAAVNQIQELEIPYSGLAG